MIFDIDITACFTGHRIVKRDFNYKRIDEAIEDLYESGYRIFLNGMALGFDTLCFKRLMVLRKVYPDIKIIACVPCNDQAELFSESALRTGNYHVKKAIRTAPEKKVFRAERRDVKARADYQ